MHIDESYFELFEETVVVHLSLNRHPHLCSDYGAMFALHLLNSLIDAHGSSRPLGGDAV